MLNGVYYLAALGLFLALSLIAPMLVGLFSGEFDVVLRLGQYLILGSFFCIAVLFSLTGRKRGATKIGSYVLAVLIWVITPFYVALPMADISGLGYMDAIFETISSLTTTGATVIRDIDSLPRSIIFWRSQVQWIGGLLTLVTILLFLAPSGIGGLPKNHSSSISRAAAWNDRGKTFLSVITIARVYLATTTACFVALILAGEQPFNAMTLAMMALSTGGMLPQSGSIQSIVGQPAILILSVFLIIGATSVFWQGMVLNWHTRGLKRHRESYSIILLVLVLSLTIAALLYKAAGSSDVLSAKAALFEGFFNAASLVSTNGVETREGVFALLPVMLVIFIVIIGGGTFSTAGGLKHYRIGGMLVLSLHEIRRLIYPSAIGSEKFGSQAYDANLLQAIWAYFTVAILVLSLFTIILNMTGLEFNASLVAALSAFSNIGPLYNNTWAPQGGLEWPIFADLSFWAKATLMLLMVLGRIEILAVLAMLNVKYWLRR